MVPHTGEEGLQNFQFKVDYNIAHLWGNLFNGMKWNFGCNNNANVNLWWINKEAVAVNKTKTPPKKMSGQKEEIDLQLSQERKYEGKKKPFKI